MNKLNPVYLQLLMSWETGFFNGKKEALLVVTTRRACKKKRILEN